MLNRIYIIVGTLAIIVLAGAFIAPYFIRWSDYRGRMEELATAMLGTPVTVRGDIEFTLLPQPRLHFADVLVGSPEEPAATVDSVEAEFSLMDFLRDNYDITRLVLRQPVIDFTVDENGFFGSGVSVASGDGGIGLGQTTIMDATVRLIDRRSGENFVADRVSGDLRLSNFSGPFGFSGTGIYSDQSYSLRINSGTSDAAGNSRVAAFVQPQSGSFSLSAEGLLATGMAPKFNGDIIYRQKPPIADAVGDIRGDLVFESKVAASTDRIVLSGYTFRPDENRSGTRLTGAASIQLGDVRSFDAVISGGVFSLPPRDAKEDGTALPYEAVRLLAELPAPIIPPMAGRVGIDLAEVGLRGFSLRDLRVDASTDGTSWTIQQLTGQLAGDTRLSASGQLTSENDRPAFRGDVSLSSNRLDGLAALWRKPGDGNPLFNLPGSLSGRVMLVGDAFGFTNGVLALNERNHRFEVRLGFGEEKRLDLVGHFDELDASGSAAITALLPDIANEPAFANSFPSGSFSLTGKRAQILGLDGESLVAEGRWESGQIGFSRLAAENLGGIGFDVALAANGTLDQPMLSGSGMIRVEAGDAPALQKLYDMSSVSQGWRDYLALSAPAKLLVNIGEPIDGAQTITLDGALGVGDLNLRAELSAGLAGLAEAPIRVTAGLESSNVDEFTRQLGLGDAELFAGDGSMLVSVNVEGVPGTGLVSSVRASLGEESIGFAGSLLAGADGEMQGTGTLDGSLADAGALARIIGAHNVNLPPVNGSAQLHFEGNRLARLTDIAGRSGDTGFTGELGLSRVGDTTAVSGDISLDLISVEGLATALFGDAALVEGDGVWPEGPLGLDMAARDARGTVLVSANALAVDGNERFGATSFEFNWDETRTRLSRFEAVSEGGRLGLDIAVCCAGPLVDRTVSGRMTLTAMPIRAVTTSDIGEALDGLVEGGVQFEGTGASLAEVLSSISGEGNFTLTGFAAQRLSPEVFPTVAGLDDVLNMEPDAINAIMGLALEQGAFTAPTATGAFTIAGGVVRLANFIVEGEGAQLAGSLNVALSSLGLNGTFALTPLGFDDAAGLVGPDTSRIVTRLAGTLLAPEVALDLNEMIAAILVRANEMEVDRLEILRAEDAERQRAAAEERNRLIEAQRQRAAEEAAQLAAEEAARQAEEAEAERIEQERLQQQQEEFGPSVQTLPNTQNTRPFTLDFPQNQANPVNQPY